MRTAPEAASCLRRRIRILLSWFVERAGRVYGALMSMLTTMKGIPLAYNKDMQEDKELTFDAIDTVKGCLALFTGMISTMTFNKDSHGSQCKDTDLPMRLMLRIIW